MSGGQECKYEAACKKTNASLRECWVTRKEVWAQRECFAKRAVEKEKLDSQGREITWWRHTCEEAGGMETQRASRGIHPRPKLEHCFYGGRSDGEARAERKLEQQPERKVSKLKSTPLSWPLLLLACRDVFSTLGRRVGTQSLKRIYQAGGWPL